MRNIIEQNPTDSIDLSFRNYVALRQAELDRHVQDGIPDYAFGLDRKLRGQLAAFAPMRQMGEAVLQFSLSLQKQLLQTHAVAVQPKVFPRVYGMTEACAKRLGIGMPRVFVLEDVTLNAYTLAADDKQDIVVLHSALVEALSDAELTSVIGHECGHIHNVHSVYNTVAEMATSSGTSVLERVLPRQAIIANLLRLGLGAALLSWSRCAEITCDRAGAICCGDIEAAQRALVKLKTGGASRDEIDLESFARQQESVKATSVLLAGAFQTHPFIPKRVEALQWFGRSDLFYSWRPDLPKPQQTIDVEALNEGCEGTLQLVRWGKSTRALLAGWGN